MAVNQNGAPPGLMFVARPDNWMAFRGHELRLQADAVQLLHQPVCALDEFFFVLVVGRNAWKPQERIILLKIIVAHGFKSKPGLPQTSNTQRYEKAIVGWAHRLPCTNLASGALALQQQIHVLARSGRTIDVRTKYKIEASASTMPVTTNSR